MIYLGEYGKMITIDVGIDISEATATKIRYQKPKGLLGEWIATITGTTTMGYILLEGDIDTIGRWQLQSYIETPVSVNYGSKVILDVDKPL